MSDVDSVNRFWTCLMLSQYSGAAEAPVPGSQYIMAFAEPVAVLGESEVWQKLVERRGEDLHRWRPQTNALAGVTRATPWKRDKPGTRSLGVGVSADYVAAQKLAGETAAIATAAMVELAEATKIVEETCLRRVESSVGRVFDSYDSRLSLAGWTATSRVEIDAGRIQRVSLSVTLSSYRRRHSSESASFDLWRTGGPLVGAGTANHRTGELTGSLTTSPVSAVNCARQGVESMDRRHGLKELRGLDAVPQSPFYKGRFGRLFRRLPPAEHSEGALANLAAGMIDGQDSAPTGGWNGQASERDNTAIPAGYTYLGQFIDHDLTFDPASSLQRQNDPDALVNFRTPRFDLDSVYGEGPEDEPFLYDQDPASPDRMLLGRTDSGDFDLPRGAQEVALIGDPRNDENVIVSQLHTVFLQLHNRVVEEIRAEGRETFERARQLVRWHYQKVVVEDFLVRVAGLDVVKDALDPEGDKFVVSSGEASTEVARPKVDLRFFSWKEQPYMPVEFSVAAYRFGHTMIRPRYDLNDSIRDRPIFDPQGTRGGGQDLRGFQRLLPGWGAKWALFFELDESQPPQPSRRLDTLLAEGLSSLPFAKGVKSLAERNLLRGRSLGLPSGEDVARSMCIEPLSVDEIAITALGIENADEFVGSTPLWFYILREADIVGGGRRLGPVGGRIVTEVLIGLLDGDPFSYIRVFPCWQPIDEGIIPQRDANRLTMPDLIRFATGT